MRKIVIIGGGISGVFAAIKLKERYQNNVDITILEAQDRPLKKLLATGNGRCNLSHKNIQMKNYDGEIDEKLYQIISSFDIEKEMMQEGLLIKRIGELYYPYSESAKSTADVLLDRIARLNIKIKTNTFVSDCQRIDGLYHISASAEEFFADDVILAIGTQAGGQSGSYNRETLLERFHLSYQPLIPMLTKFTTDPALKSLKGLRVKGVMTLKQNGTILASEHGEMLVTDYGVSGIAIMQLSRYYREGCTLHVDLMPSYSRAALRTMLAESALSEPLTGLIHSRLITYCRKEKLDPVAFLKNWTLRVTGLKGASDAQVMRGGVMLNSLDHRFQSKKFKHLYVIGEILNLTGDCGGYNIHFALASASYLAEHIYDE